MSYVIAPDSRTTAHFVLRSYMPGDGERLREGLHGSYEHLRRFLDWASPDVTPDEAERRARFFRAQYLLSRDFVIGVFDPGDGRLLGGTGFHMREDSAEDESAEIGMWVRKGAAARGLGTQILVEMLDWGFSAWPWQRLSWRCRADNDASRRVAQKAGLRQEGVLRGFAVDRDGRRHDTVCFAALRDEWTRPAAAGDPALSPACTGDVA